MRKYFAHSENDNNERNLSAKHLYHTAKLMEDCSFSECFKPIFKIAGLLHDLGKYRLAFQDFLENGERCGSVPHARLGAEGN